MKYTLGTASKATGKSKSTLSRDIKSGKISAVYGDNGAYEIEPSELHRVYPAISRDSPIEQSGTGGTGIEKDGLREQIELLKSERDYLRHCLNVESEERRKLTMLLTHQPETPTEQKTESKLLMKLFGRLHLL